MMSSAKVRAARKRVPHSLTEEELTELAALLRKAFDCISQLKAASPVAAAIQYPKLPSIFTESLIMRCGPVLFPDARDLRRGGAVADILFEAGTHTKKVEIKATGQQAFQYFGPKDISADFLVWLAFGELFRNQAESPKSPIRTYLLAGPGQVFPDPTKITLATFERRAVGKLTRYQADLHHMIEGKLERLP
jgi:hypothetical protein